MKARERASETKSVSASGWLAGFLTAVALIATFTIAGLVLGGIGESEAKIAGPPTKIEMRITDDKGDKLKVDLESFEWGVKEPMGSGGGGGPGSVQVSDLTVTKYADKASTDLHKMCCTGTDIKEVILTVYKAGGKQGEYLEFTMSDVMFTSYSIGGNDGDVVPLEEITLNYGTMRVEYMEQKKGGGAGTVEYDCWAFPECLRH